MCTQTVMCRAACIQVLTVLKTLKLKDIVNKANVSQTGVPLVLESNTDSQIQIKIHRSPHPSSECSTSTSMFLYSCRSWIIM